MNKQLFMILIIVSVLCFNMPNKVSSNEITNIDHTSCIGLFTNDLEKVTNNYFNMDYEQYESNDAQIEEITLPWMNFERKGLLEWWLRLEYGDQTFDKKVEVSIDNFAEKFLKHPEYGEIIKFNIDSDPEDDVEIIVGFYWSVISYPDGGNARSLESRLRIRQLPNGGIEDAYGEFQVWSELRLNYGLIKSIGKIKSSDNLLENSFLNKILYSYVFQDSNRFTFLNKIIERIRMIFEEDIRFATFAISHSALSNEDADYISIGAGYKSEEGIKIPSLVEKKFSFAKGFNLRWKDEGNIFEPIIFQHETDPDSDEPIELLYGFQAYEGSTDTKKFDIAFSLEFDPAIYLKTKFVPLDGIVYYYFKEKSQSVDTKITFSSNIFEGNGEGVSLSLTFDRIDENLGRTGRWMMFDIGIIDGDLLGGGFHYEASHKQSVAIAVNSPVFQEKVRIKGIPTNVDFGWDVDVDFLLLPSTVDVSFSGELSLEMDDTIDDVIVYYPKSDPQLDDSVFVEVENVPSYQRLRSEASLYLHNGSFLTVRPDGHIDLTMSSSIGDIKLFYPKAELSDPDSIFIHVPDGSIPAETTVGAIVDVHVDLGNLLNQNNYVSGRIYHESDSNLKEVDVYLPSTVYNPDQEKLPLVKVTEIPARSSAEARINWAKLEGYADVTRGYVGRYDPIEINLGFGGFNIYNKLEIREGFIRTGFRIAENGYFSFDTADRMLKNVFRVSSESTELDLKNIEITVEEVSADNLHASWDIDTSGDQMKFNGLNFGGLVDTLKDLEFNIDYMGKSSSLNLDWSLGGSGAMNFDFVQEDPLILEFDIDNRSETFDLNGYVILPSNPHFDISWKWIQGERYIDPGYFKLNENSNQVFIEDVNLYMVYQDMWGADISLSNAGIYASVEWYWENLRFYLWPVIDIYGEWDLHLLLNGQWYYNVEDFFP